MTVPQSLTLDQVLTSAEALPDEEQEILETLLRQRRIQNWRLETAATASQALQAFHAGTLTPEPVETVIRHLRAGLATEAD